MGTRGEGVVGQPGAGRVATRAGRPPSQSSPQTGEEVGGDAAAGRVRWIPVFTGIYFHNNDGMGVVGGVARGGGRRFPRRAPPGAHKGSPLRMGRAATRDRPYGWGGRPRGIAPTYGEGGHKGSPLRMGMAPTRDRSYGWGGRPRGIAPTYGEGAHKGSPLRMGRAATRDRPYVWGGRPEGIAPTYGEGAQKGSPLRMGRAPRRDRPYVWGGRPEGIAPTYGEGGHKGSPLRMGRAARRDRPYGWGGRPEGIAPTDGEGAQKGSPLRVFCRGRPCDSRVIDNAHGCAMRGKIPISIFPRRRDLCINPSCPLRADLITPILIFFHRKIGGL